MKSTTVITSIIIVILAGIFVWQRFSRDSFPLPQGGETVSETIKIQDGEVVDTPREEEKEITLGSETIKQIMITDGVRHSVPLNEILSGGPGKDGIPPIDNPKFISIAEADKWLDNDEPGVTFSKDGVSRFYPYQILVWHEIVNDTVLGQRILVTYCPLCLTGFIFDPVVGGERVEFGTSGKLWKSNLVMYDRKTDSLWSQVLGKAILGEMTGTKLKTLPSDQVRYGNWKKQFPKGEALSRDTGTTRFYGSSPYGDYFSVTNLSLTLAKPTDTRLPNDAFVFGIVINGFAKAYHTEAIKAKGTVEDIFQGERIILRYDQELDVVRMFKKLSDGSEERINPISGFWFSWAAAHPETELFK